jgi:cysteine-rich repeat protein
LEQPDLSACTADADCAAGSCVIDTATPDLVALFCSTKAVSSAIDRAFGSPGPGTLTLKTLVRMCRCGDGAVGCAEECDDGGLQDGDGCDRACQAEGT